jgi:dCMP deaminase
MSRAQVWDDRFLQLASLVASWSKDPSTQVGCVVVRSDRTVASCGFNGFPRGVEDREQRLQDRETKYAMVVHAEANAVLTAHERLDGSTAYVTSHPCSGCAGLMIQAGIKRVVVPHPSVDMIERWGESLSRAKTMFIEARVKLELVG